MKRSFSSIRTTALQQAGKRKRRVSKLWELLWHAGSPKGQTGADPETVGTAPRNGFYTSISETRSGCDVFALSRRLFFSGVVLSSRSLCLRPFFATVAGVHDDIYGLSSVPFDVQEEAHDL